MKSLFYPWILAIVCASSCAQSIPKPVPADLPQNFEAIILGGGKTEDDAKKAISDFQTADAYKVKPAAGFPKIYESENLPGTPPETYFAVLGFCPKAKDSKVMSRMIRSISTGAYSATVGGEFPGTCPILAPELREPEPPPGAKASRQTSPTGKKQK